MRYFRVILSFVFLTFWTINCSAADGSEEHKIVINKIGDGFSLGVVITDLNDEAKAELKAEKGARVIHVLEESAAKEIGMQKDDVIISFDGKDVDSASELNDLMEDIEKEKTVELIVLRDGKEKTFEADIKKSENKNYSFAFSDDDQDGIWNINEDGGNLAWVSEGGEGNFSAFHFGGESKGGFLGVSAENLNKQMLEYFEVEHGVLVEKVIEDSPAEKAGLKAGDVITYISGREIESYNDLTRTINYYNPDEEISIDFVRKGSKKSTTAVLIKKKNDDVFFRGDKNLIIEAPDPVVAPGVHVEPPKVFKNFNFRTNGKVGKIFII